MAQAAKDEAASAAPNGTDSAKLVPIPEPPQHLLGLLGNLPDVDSSFPVRSFWHLMELYGPIVKIQLAEPVVLVGSQELVNEICDQDRFKKVPQGALIDIRALTGDGLFTAYLEEPNWAKAHRLLTPAFGPLGIRKMFDGMLDISSQMVLKWDRQGPEHQINCSDDLTRLAFDTIGLCAFSYRFNEFYGDNMHPFAIQMAEVLLESGKKAQRPAWLESMVYHKSEEHRQENVRKMHALCDEIIQDRKVHPQPDNHDLLNTMLNGVDKETGEKLSDENIRYQLATFLVAGHETTSATLSFAYYNLCKNPDKLFKAQQQVDEVVGDNVISLDMIPKLTWVDAIIKETLRLSSPIGIFSVNATDNQVLAGKYSIPKGQTVRAILKLLHQDPKVWGDDRLEFKPERMMDGGFQKLPPNSWKPFGNGVRACIGRGFAEQEMMINLALVLQRFEIKLADPNYELDLKSTLTIKPKDFFMKVKRRSGKALFVGVPGGVPAQVAEKHQHVHEKAQGSKPAADGEKKQVEVFFGGETGTCESLAQTLHERGPDFGLEVDVQSLDAAIDNLSKDRPCVIISSSYEGKPPANAKKFVSWLGQLDSKSDQLSKVQFTVFGVGNSDWVNTYLRVPNLIDEKLESLGAKRILDAGSSDVKKDLIGPWEEWSEKLLQALAGGEGKVENTVGVDVEVHRSSLPQALGGQEMKVGIVVHNTELVDNSVGPAKRHMDVRLPEGSSYTAGDYLVIQARNSEDLVRRVLARFAMTEDDMIIIKGSRKKFLPDEPTSVEEFLLTTVELATPITKRQLSVLVDHTQKDSNDQQALEKLLDESEYEKLLKKRFSILDILEDYPMLDLPFGVFVDMLQPLAPRQYSISSSSLDPRNNPGKLEHADIASITYDVHDSPAMSGHGQFHGIASSYLATRRPGDRISCFVRATNVGFRLPSDTETPVIMMAAGTGIAPMRAFLEERAAIKAAGVRKLGPAMLFFGCRNENKDYIYKDELEEWEKQGIVEIKTAFSKPDSGPKKYVNEVVEDNQDRVAELFRSGGKIYLCGSAARLGRSCAESCKKIYRDKKGANEKEADEWLENTKVDRYISDVF